MGRASRPILSLVFILLLAGSVSAEDMRISYLEGRVEVQSGSAWRLLSIGDPLAADATLRLAAHSYAEFSTGGTRITLSEPGTYAVKSLVSASRSLRSAGAGRVLTNILTEIVGSSGDHKLGTSGVRGDLAEGEGDSQWISGSAELSYRDAKDLMEAGQADKAIDALEKGLAEADPEELAEGHWYLAQAYSLKGDARNALLQLETIHPAASDAWARDFVLLKAKLLIDAFAFDSAVEWLSEQGGDLETDAQRGPAYYFLLGLASRGAGDVEKEKRYLGKVVSDFGDTDLAAEAARMLQSP